MDFILDLVRALGMAQTLPFFVALLIYIMAYAGAVWAVAKAAKAIKDLWVR